MKKLLLSLVFLLGGSQIFTADKPPVFTGEGEPSAKCQRTDNAVTGVAPQGTQQPMPTYSVMPMYHPGMYLSTTARIPFPMPQQYPVMMYPMAVGHQPPALVPGQIVNTPRPPMPAPVSVAAAAAAELSKVEDYSRSRRKPFQYLQKIREEDGKVLYICNHPDCKKEIWFKNQDSTQKHEKDHSNVDNKIFPCEKGCSDKFFPRDDKRKYHYRSMHSEGEGKFLQCEGCEKKYISESALRSHQQTTHNPDFVPFKCEKCGTTFNKKTNMQRHLKENRCKDKAKRSMQAPVSFAAAAAAELSKVEDCSRSRRKPFQYLQKIREEDGKVLYICNHPDCKKEIWFKNQDSTQKHEKDHSNRDNEIFPCEKGCSDKFFTRNNERKAHYKSIHSNDEPAAEEISSQSPVNALSDKSVEEAKIYTCIYEDCPQHGERFSKEEMIKHCENDHGMQEEDIELEDFCI